ncbi:MULTISPECIES: protein DpdH [unclassified Streptomyces]|uniref:protein DpdH n=1 Tax=unclassified Streptomyces TaxID=2593676 RepID=UPI002DD98A3F|nr:protein DpdH [Streptomyces sp. NBC_01788]WSB24508.1 protein DpdH [Streptomyces sp. NBC_01788]
MPELRDYVCWDVERVVSTIQTEAVVASPAVFLATHTPLQIQRAEIEGRQFTNTGQLVSEKDVLKDFLGRKTATGTVLMPIVGESGSGKSHLVRWVRENLLPSDKRKVIYLEKSKTSLRHVIESLLEGVDDEEITQIRSDVRGSTSGTNASALALRLINELMIALAGTVAGELRGKQRQLAGLKGLALILQDPVLQDQMLEEGKFIPRFAEHMLSDRGSDAERPPLFTVDDLPLSVASVMDGVAAPTRVMLRLLLSKPQMRDAAVDMLNEYWEKSVQATSSLGGGRVLDAMKKVREIYARQGKEIVLLVEDFALIQGVQRDLLDAITETSQREGRTALAPMRTLMAITSGYFHDLPETALTRIEASTGGHVYNLDLVLEEDSPEAVASFAGRYLNAARVGRKELEHAGESVPNQCEKCPFQAPCHDTFGKSAEGYGLYPFNRFALNRTVHSVAPAAQPKAFVPRTVLSRALIPVLTEGFESIQEGSFPDEQFRGRFKSNREAGDLPLASRVREQIEDLDQTDGARREKLLEFWANSPAELVNLERGIATAFSLPDLPLDTDRPSALPQTPKATVKSPVVAPPDEGQSLLPPSLQKRLDLVENWSTGDTGLPTAEASTVRSMVSRAAFYRQDWLNPPVKPLSSSQVDKAGWTNKASTVSIEQASAEALARGDSPVIFKRKPANAEFFKSLILLSTESTVGVRPQDVVRLSSMADRYARILRERVTEQSQVADDDLVAGMRVSLMGAALAGQAHPGMPLEKLHAAAFDSGQSWKRPDASSRTDMWQRSLISHLAKRGPLVDTLRGALGVGQGTGAVQVVDAARALPLLRRALTMWELGETELPKWAQDAAQSLAGWRVLVPSQHAHLTSLLQGIRERFPRGERSADLLGQLGASLRVAVELGLEGGGQVPVIRQLMEEIQDADWASVTVLEKDLAKFTPGLEKADVLAAMLQGVVPLRDAHLAGMHRLLQEADAFLSDALRSAQERGQTAASTASQQMEALMDAWEQIAQVAPAASEGEK